MVGILHAAMYIKLGWTDPEPWKSMECMPQFGRDMKMRKFVFPKDLFHFQTVFSNKMFAPKQRLFTPKIVIPICMSLFFNLLQFC